MIFVRPHDNMHRSCKLCTNMLSQCIAVAWLRLATKTSKASVSVLSKREMTRIPRALNVKNRLCTSEQAWLSTSRTITSKTEFGEKHLLSHLVSGCKNFQICSQQLRLLPGSQLPSVLFSTTAALPKHACRMLKCLLFLGTTVIQLAQLSILLPFIPSNIAREFRKCSTL